MSFSKSALLFLGGTGIGSGGLLGTPNSLDSSLDFLLLLPGLLSFLGELVSEERALGVELLLGIEVIIDEGESG